MIIKLNMPKQENMANSRMATIRFIKREPSPIAVVTTASTVGKEIVENVKKDASARDSAFWE